jgi:hypothetical protein
VKAGKRMPAASRLEREALVQSIESDVSVEIAGYVKPKVEQGQCNTIVCGGRANGTHGTSRRLKVRARSALDNKQLVGLSSGD